MIWYSQVLFNLNVTSVTPSNVLTVINNPLDTLAAKGERTVRMPVSRTPSPMTILPPYLSAAIPPKILEKR